MALYFLTYDLSKSKNSQPLYDKLQKMDTIRILKSTWCFYDDDTSVKDLRDQFKHLVDRDAELMLAEVSDWASLNLDRTPRDI